VLARAGHAGLRDGDILRVLETGEPEQATLAPGPGGALRGGTPLRALLLPDGPRAAAIRRRACSSSSSKGAARGHPGIRRAPRARRPTRRWRGARRISSILDTVPDAMVVIDERGLVQSFSAAAERLFGHTAAEVRGRNVSMLMPAPYREGARRLHRALPPDRRARIIGHRPRRVGPRKDGGTFPMELAVGEVNSGGQRLFTGFIRDLTERQETQARCRSCKRS
jgi:two-component system sensor kinase FixL